MGKLIFFISFCAAFIILPASAGWEKASCQPSGNIFDHITTQDGLSSNGVSDVIQDREGFYWISTQNGLNRFDGTNFKTFYNNPRDSNSLTHDHCTSLAEDNEGNIWVGTMKGVSCFIKKENKFINYSFRHKQMSDDIVNRIWNIVKDDEGNIWVSGILLMQFDIKSKNWINFSDRLPGNLGKNLSSIKHIAYDKTSKGIWITSSESVYFYSIQAKQMHYAEMNPLQLKIFSSKPYLVAPDTKGRVWFYNAETQNIFLFSPQTNTVRSVIPVEKRGIRHIKTDDKNRLWIFYWNGPSAICDENSRAADNSLFVNVYPKSVINPAASNLFIDKNNNYWITSDHGISILNNEQQFFTYYMINDKAGDLNEMSLTIKNIAESKGNFLWMATTRGLYQYDINNKKYFRTQIPGLRKPLDAIFNLNDTMLWINNSDGNIVRYNTFSGETQSRFVSVSRFLFFRKAEKERIWASTWNDGVYCFDRNGEVIEHLLPGYNRDESLISKSVIAFEHGRQPGEFWIGYNGGGGFSNFNSLTKKFHHYSIQMPRSKNISNTVNCIYEEPGGNLWLGTYGGGLYYFDRIANHYINYLQTDGLYSNFVNAIIPDKSGNLWIATTVGLNYLNSVNKQIVSVPIDLALHDNDFFPNLIKDSSDKLYFFRDNVVIEVKPERFNKNSSTGSVIKISAMRIFNDEVPFSANQSRVSLSHNQNFFSFDFSLLKTNPSQRVEYAYQLKGFDKDWNLAISRTTANYTNVPPGSYTFLLKATNQAGQWVYNSVPVNIIITPPFWKTWWFIILLALAIAGSLYALYRYRINQVKRIFNLRDKISQDLHDDIGASLSSIHIYSSVAEKTIGEDTERSKTMLRQINYNTRKVMEDMSDIVWAMNTKKTEETSFSNRIKNYGYDLLSQKNIECDYLVDAQAEKKLQKPEARKNILLIVKEAMNNIAKYSGASHAAVHITTDEKNILIKINDNGKGFNGGTIQTGNGLNNMKQRSTMLGGNFMFNSSPGHGTTIQCSIPLTNISDR